MEIASLIGSLEHFSYFAIFILLSVAGYLVPLPEEVLLISIGYLLSTGVGHIPTVLIVSLLGLIVGDNLVYWLARFNHRFTDKFRAKLKPKTLEKYEQLMKKHARLTVFGTRFIAGLRFLGPFLAGSHKIKWSKFQFFNLLALLIYTPLFLFLGYHFHARLEVLIAQVEFIRHIIFVTAIILLGIAGVYLIRRWIYKGDKNETVPSPELQNAIKEARKERKSKKIKSFKNIKSVINHLKKT